MFETVYENWWDELFKHETSKIPTKRSRLIWECFVFFVVAIVAGAMVGIAWRGPELSLLGVPGLGLYFHGQLRQRKLRWRLFQSAAFGYVGFLVSNFWMAWTIESTAQLGSSEAVLFSHLIHLLHGGMFVLFSFLGWIAERRIRNGWLLFPLAFVAAELIWPSLFPFRQGCLLFVIPQLVQSVSVFGIAAASLQIALLSCLLPLGVACVRLFKSPFQIGRPQAVLATLAIITITLVNFAWGQWRMQTIEHTKNNLAGETFSALVVQNDTTYATYHIDLMKRSRQNDDDCDLIVWPECSIGHFDRSLTGFSDFRRLAKLSYGYGYDSVRPLSDPDCYLLAGGYSSSRLAGDPATEDRTELPEYEDEEDEHQLESKFVTAFLINPAETIVGRHDKVKLMAGGEYTPAEWLVSEVDDWFEPWTTLDEGLSEEMEEDFEAGPENHPLSSGTQSLPIGTIDDVSVGAMLCCEDMYPSISRELTASGADVLICLANGTCFNEEAALYQHFLISRFRAIENNRYLLRCGSLGVSALVSPSGEVVDRLPCFEDHSMRVEIPKENRQFSIFTRHGSWPLFAVCIFAYLTIGRSAVFATKIQ